MKIIDDGIGFENDRNDKISSTMVIRERIELINQAGDFFITKDKEYLDPSSEDKGTVIIFTIRYES